MSSYFDKFPRIVYSNTICIDISRRVVVANNVQNNLYAYHPYELKSHHRADTIANLYYDNPYYSWMVYLSNKTIDPYYSFPLIDDVFMKYIIKKYGSMENAKQKILFWELNWSGDAETDISVEFYRDTLPEPLKKYYEAIYGEGTRIIKYRRRREDWTINTNRIVTFFVENSTNDFEIDETVSLKTSSNTIQSNSVIVFSNSSQVTVQHVFGNTTIGNNHLEFLYGNSSNATANVTSMYIVANNVSIAEQVYWSPVYAWDYEESLNEQKKFIKLIDSKYTLDVENSLEKKLNE